ncbi:MAG: carbon storage regulator CsrA [Leptospiraceae bacterium]|nr:carbon storage regulator CsrA [Leptospiraceae bacterium]MCP5499976.1 carbon storage regulator CsrA [Leptospiraceae bacterium]
MLVLSRRLNQSIMIGNDIELTIIDIKGDQVKIGIKAPRNVSVHRAEVYKEIQEENRKATQSNIRPEDLGKLGNIFKKKESVQKTETH